MEPMIRVEHISKTFRTGNGEVEAVKDISFSIEKGEIFGIIGLSGAGKSTLVRCLNLLERPEEGKVLIDRIDLMELSPAGLSDKAKAYPAQLSGGQKQRVAIARVLASQPKILLCDEATSALDPQTTRSLLSLLKEINRELGITIVVITHQMAVVREICSRVAVMDHGRLVEEGTIEEVFDAPKTEEAKQLIADTYDAAAWNPGFFENRSKGAQRC